MDIVREVEAAVNRRLQAPGGPAGHDDRVVVAVSGGADSTATAAAVIESGAVPAERVTVAHFDHRLRGDDEAARERAAVHALCARYRLALVEDAWDAPQPSEQAAREARYRFLARAAANVGATAVVTGHTADDQAETVLMRLLRGAGWHGLAGMAVESSLPATVPDGTSVRLLRPMLGVSREQTRAYCAARGLAYHDDPTNADHDRLRSRVRHELLPRLEDAKPGARGRLLRLAGAARRRAAALDAAAAPALLGGGPGEAWLSRPALRALPAEAAGHAARLAVMRLLGDVREFDRRHYRRLVDAAAGRTGATLELPRGVRATVDAGAVLLTVGPPGPPPVPAGVAAGLPFHGELGGWRLRVEPAPVQGAETVLLPPDAVVRARRPGDRIRLHGGRGAAKLQDYYVDRKVPRRERDAAPVIARGSDVFWTPFGAAARPPDGSPYVLACEHVGAGPPVLDGLSLRRYDSVVSARDAPALASPVPASGADS